MFELLIFFYLILFSGLAYFRPVWAISLIVFALPSYLIRFEVLGLPFNLLGAMIWIAFLVWFLFQTKVLKFLQGKYQLKDFKKNREKRLFYPFGVELILLLIISFTAVFVAGLKPESLGSFRAYFFEPALFFILLLNLFQTKEKRELLIWALAMSSLLLSSYAIFQKITGFGITNEFWQAEATRRVTSIFPYPNALALYLAPLSMIFLGYVTGLVKQVKTFTWKAFLRIALFSLIIVLSWLAIYFTKSEGALIAGFFSSLLFLWFLKGKWRWLAYAMVVLTLGFLIFAPGPRGVVFEKATLSNLSGEIRKKQWRETWQMLKDDRIIFGAGLHNYQEAVKPYYQEGIFFNKDKDPDFRRKIVLFNEEYRSKFWQPVEIYLYPHNIIFNFWSELGLAGVIVFFWIIIKFFAYGIKILKIKPEEKNNAEKLFALGLILAMVVIIVHGLVDVPYFKNDLAILFWLVIALNSLIFVKFFKNKFLIKS